MQQLLRCITALYSIENFTAILLNRLKPYSENIIREYQAGFRKGRLTTDQLLIDSNERDVGNSVHIYITSSWISKGPL
jgi:hypothetical protein